MRDNMKKVSNFDDAEVYTDDNQCKPLGRLVLVVNQDKSVFDCDADNNARLTAEIRARRAAAKKLPGVIIAS